VRPWLRWLGSIRCRPSESVVPPNWQHATEGTLDYLARRYNLPVVQKDIQGEGKRFPAFKNEFFRELAKRL
jgi:hypothetical protein